MMSGVGSLNEGFSVKCLCTYNNDGIHVTHHICVGKYTVFKVKTYIHMPCCWWSIIYGWYVRTVFPWLKAFNNWKFRMFILKKNKLLTLLISANCCTCTCASKSTYVYSVIVFYARDIFCIKKAKALLHVRLDT